MLYLYTGKSVGHHWSFPPSPTPPRGCLRGGGGRTSLDGRRRFLTHRTHVHPNTHSLLNTHVHMCGEDRHASHEWGHLTRENCRVPNIFDCGSIIDDAEFSHVKLHRSDVTQCMALLPPGSVGGNLPDRQPPSGAQDFPHCFPCKHLGTSDSGLAGKRPPPPRCSCRRFRGQIPSCPPPSPSSSSSSPLPPPPSPPPPLPLPSLPDRASAMAVPRCEVWASQTLTVTFTNEAEAMTVQGVVRSQLGVTEPLISVIL